MRTPASGFENYSITNIYTFVSLLVNILLNLYSELRKNVFASRAVEEGLKLPEIHLLINNRVSEYELRCVFCLLIKYCSF